MRASHLTIATCIDRNERLQMPQVCGPYVKVHRPCNDTKPSSRCIPWPESPLEMRLNTFHAVARCVEAKPKRLTAKCALRQCTGSN